MTDYDKGVGFCVAVRKLPELDRDAQCKLYQLLSRQPPTRKLADLNAYDLQPLITECELMAAMNDEGSDTNITIGEFLQKHRKKLLPLAA